MGLELNMFEDKVPQELLCTFCGRVLVQPEMSTCKHVFCSWCLNSHVPSSCPSCGAWLEKTTFPAPAETRRKLLDLTVRCDHKCGKVMALGKLPEHVASECPNTPVKCEYVYNGCGKNVRRCHLSEHMKECDFKTVKCEACGYMTLKRDLSTHQSKKRCAEMRLKRQLIQAVRSTRSEIKRHQKHLERQQIRVEQYQRRIEMDHHRKMTAVRRQRQKQKNYNIPMEDITPTTTNNNNSSLSSSFDFQNPDLALDGLGNLTTRFWQIPSTRLSTSRESNHASFRNTFSRERATPAPERLSLSREQNSLAISRITISRDKSNPLSNRVTASRENPPKLQDTKRISAGTENSKQIQNPKSNEKPSQLAERITTSRDRLNQQVARFSLNRDKPDQSALSTHQMPDLFLTTTTDDDTLVSSPTCQDPDVRKCKNCRKSFRGYKNKPNSCRWHIGPIIELYGGTCFSCGRLDYQVGCMMGFHEI